MVGRNILRNFSIFNKTRTLSHLKERKDKICLNCRTEVHGRFCHVCGQENIEPVETAWHLIQHFLYDLTHFDGKFFSTGKKLITKPGFLSREYVAGRRSSYLNPIRMYIFTSAFFFLIFFSSFDLKPRADSDDFELSGMRVSQIQLMDSAAFSKFSYDFFKGKPRSREEFNKYVDSLRTGIHLTSTVYRSREHYDSLLAAGVKKHNWIQRSLIYREIDLNKKYNNDNDAITSAFVNKIVHSFPQVLFLSLPLFALLLKGLYVRQKRFLYVSHLIFSINFYIFAFLTMLVLMLVIKIEQASGWSWLSIVKFILLLSVLFYEYKSMRNFYGQNRLTTILKFVALNIGHLVIMIILLLLSFVFSIMNI